MLVEAVGQLFDQPGLGQLLAEQPKRHCVRNAVLDRAPESARTTAGRAPDIPPARPTDCWAACRTSILNIRMASNGFRPALLFLSSSGVSTTASISARKLSHGTR